ncbi:phospholipid carrier-dependent glycosyltransferase [candidate division WWE3 bacterium]|nr:phospholipid carrier-dependent glycosyltransferase [candidate division WWE3 bacterium]
MQKSGKVFAFLAIVVFFLIYAATRLPRLDSDIISTDSVYWHNRSENFLEGIQTKNYILTFQKYHPGVTLMWLMAGTAHFASLVKNTTYDQVFLDFEGIEYFTKLTLVSWQFILSIFLIYLLSKTLRNFWVSFFTVLLFNIEPFYVGNSRLIHHDAQISLYIMIAFCLVYLFFEKAREDKFDYASLMLSAFFLAIAALSKTLFMGAFLFAFSVINVLFLLEKKSKVAFKFGLMYLFSYFLFYYALFPALWVDFSGVLKQIFFESYDTSEGGGHLQILFGEVTRDPGPLFYILLLITKTSLVGLVGIFLFIFQTIFKKLQVVIKNGLKSTKQQVNFLNFLTIFYVAYFLLICYFNKKVDRYTITLYPFLALIAVYGWNIFYQSLRQKALLFASSLLLFIISFYTILLPMIKIFPHYLTYVNPVFGDASDSNKIIGQKLFGIGIFDLRDKIIKHFGDSTSVAINDIGPLQSIYPKGRVYNVLVEHPNSYKVLVLGPNKDLPKSVKTEKIIKFKQVDSVYINGLEFWRIYKKTI